MPGHAHPSPGVGSALNDRDALDDPGIIEKAAPESGRGNVRRPNALESYAATFMRSSEGVADGIHRQVPAPIGGKQIRQSGLAREVLQRAVFASRGFEQVESTRSLGQ